MTFDFVNDSFVDWNPDWDRFFEWYRHMFHYLKRHQLFDLHRNYFLNRCRHFFLNCVKHLFLHLEREWPDFSEQKDNVCDFTVKL